MGGSALIYYSMTNNYEPIFGYRPGLLTVSPFYPIMLTLTPQEGKVSKYMFMATSNLSIDDNIFRQLDKMEESGDYEGRQVIAVELNTVDYRTFKKTQP